MRLKFPSISLTFSLALLSLLLRWWTSTYSLRFPGDAFWWWPIISFILASSLPFFTLLFLLWIQGFRFHFFPHLASFLGSLLGLFLGLGRWILQQLIHYSWNIIFFASRHVYSSPSYTGSIYTPLPRFYDWLTRIHYNSRFSKKDKALQSRRYYLIFVWFFFSFFFRTFFLLPFLLFQYCSRWLWQASHGAWGPLQSFFRFLLYRPLYSFYHRIWASWKVTLSFNLFRLYVRLRRQIYYLSLHHHLEPFFTPLREKNRGMRENTILFDSHYLMWLLNMAAPLTMPRWRPGIVVFFSKLWTLGPTLRLPKIRSPLFVWLLLLPSFLLRSFLYLFLLPLGLLFSIFFNLLRILKDSRLHLSLVLKSSFLLERLLSLRIASLLAPFRISLLFWFGRFLGWIFKAFPLLPFFLFTILWFLLQAVAYLPLGCAHLLWAFLTFSGRRFVLSLFLLALFLFGPELVTAFASCFEELAELLLEAYQALYPSGPSAYNLNRADLLLLSSHVPYSQRWTQRINTSVFRWKAYLHHYGWGGRRSTADPFVVWALVKSFISAAAKRGANPANALQGLFPLHLEFLRCQPGTGRETGRLLTLYRISLLHPSQFLMYNVSWSYRQTILLLKLSSLFVELPWLLGGYSYLSLMHLFKQLYAFLSQKPYLNLLLPFYANYISLLIALGKSFYASSEPLGEFLSLWLRDLVTFAGGRVSSSWSQGLTSLYSFLQTKSASDNSYYWWYLCLLLDLWKHHPWNFSAFAAYSNEGLGRHLTDLILFCFQLTLVFYELVYPQGKFFLSLPPSLDCLYLELLALRDKFSDSLFLYWQLAKKPWALYGSWSRPMFLRSYRWRFHVYGKHSYRRSVFNPQSTSWTLVSWEQFALLCGEQPRQFVAYGAELRPGYRRWRKVAALLRESRPMTLQRVLRKPRFYAPDAPHLGYVNLGERMPPRYSYFWYSLQEMRFLRILFQGPFFYFFALLLLVYFVTPFRLLFFPAIADGGSMAFWSHFRHDRDPRWVEQLMLPRISIDDFSLEGQLISAPPWYLRSYKWWQYKSVLQMFQKESLRHQRFHLRDLRLTLASLWRRFAEIDVVFDEPRVESLRHHWQKRFWPFPPRPRKSQYLPKKKSLFERRLQHFKDSLYLHYFYDFKVLGAFRELYLSFFRMAQKCEYFLIEARYLNLDEASLRGCLAAYDTGEEEEIRAEYLYRNDRVKQRLGFIQRWSDFLRNLDLRLFDNKLGSPFFHKELMLTQWIVEEASYLLAQSHLKYRLTPLLFSRFIRRDSHLFRVEEDAKIYLFILFWFFLFPLCIFLQGLLFHYGWRHAWSPRGSRQATGQLWLLENNFLLHFDFFSQFMRYLWAYSSTMHHILRSGHRGAMDDPGKWSRRVSHGEFYYWPWLRHLRHRPEGIFQRISLFRGKLLGLETLSELRLLNKSLLGLQMLFFFFFLLRCLRRRTSGFLLPSSRKAPPRMATFIQQFYYKQMKLQLKKGLLWFWLKA